MTPSSPEPPRAIASGGRPSGRLLAPPSKSFTHRFLALALLSRRPVDLVRPLLAEDTRLFLAALAACGWTVEELPGEVRLTPPAIAPAGREVEIFCGNCGTMLRFLIAALAVLPGRFGLDGVERLRQRPVGPLVAALRRLGAQIEFVGRPGFVPLRIAGASLIGGKTTLDARESSQYLSALLLAALAAPEPVTVEVEALSSAPYVAVTLQAAALFGGRIDELGPAPGEARGQKSAPRVYHIRPSPLAAPRLVVEGDASAACYLGAAAALCQSTVTVAGVPASSRQGDLRFFDLLREMGAEVAWRGDELTVQGGGLQAVDADLADLPDQVPTLAALAPFARGTTHIRNVAQLRLKESDRLSAMAAELRRLGAGVEEGADSLTIPGLWADRKPPCSRVVVDPHGDHRIAMSLALTALRRPGVAISSPGVVAKSYPDFWHDLESLLGTS